MLTNQDAPSNANPVNPLNSVEQVNSGTQTERVARVESLLPTPMPGEEATRLAPDVSAAAGQDAPVTNALAAQANLPELQIPRLDYGLHIALISMALLLVAAITVWQLRRRSSTHGTTFEVLEAEPTLVSTPHKASTQKHADAAGARRGAASSAHAALDQEDEDTSKPVVRQPLSNDDFDFDDDVTYLHTPHVDRQLMGHLLRVTSEPRLPAELALYGAAPLLTAEGQISIGRHSKHNAVVIGDKSVSREHAVIIQRGQQLFVRDQASTAGTLLNWKRLTADDEQPLHHQDILSFGEAVYEFRVQAAESHDYLPHVIKPTKDDTELIGK